MGTPSAPLPTQWKGLGLVQPQLLVAICGNEPVDRMVSPLCVSFCPLHK